MKPDSKLLRELKFHRRQWKLSFENQKQSLIGTIMLAQYASEFETQILREIAVAKTQIRKMEAELQALERLLHRARCSKSDAGADVKKKQGMRQSVESKIIGMLAMQPEQRAFVQQIWTVAHAAFPNLKQTTFRSYLSRLKLRGVIRSPSYGQWQLTDNKYQNPKGG